MDSIAAGDLPPQPGTPGIPSAVFPDEGDVVRYRARGNAEFRFDVALRVPPAPHAADEHDVVADDALREILVRRAEEHFLDAGMGAAMRAAVAIASSASNSTIGQVTMPSARETRSASSN